MHVCLCKYITSHLFSKYFCFQAVKQFIKQGAVYLGLELLTVDDKATSINGSLL